MSQKRGATVDVKCKNPRCAIIFSPRVADRKRGWGKFCSKSCKASKQLSHQVSNRKKGAGIHPAVSCYRDVEGDFHPHDSHSLGQE